MFRLDVKLVEVRSPVDDMLITEQWKATVFDGKKKVYESIGSHFSTEARRFGLEWIAGHQPKI